MFSLGQRIRELRMQKGITQIELAKGLCTPSMISQIESDRARPSYKILFALAERLDVPMEKLLVDVDMNLETVSTYKMARAMIEAKEYILAIPLLQELQQIPRASISTMDILFDLGECYLHTDRLDQAESTFKEVHELAILRQDHMLTALVLKHLGQSAYLQKKHHLAIFHWQKAVVSLEKMQEPDVFLKAEIFLHLVEVYMQAEHVSEAKKYLKLAASCCEGNDNLFQMAHVYMGLGLAYKKNDELQKAVEYAERAASIFKGLDNLLMTFRVQVKTAVLYKNSGRLAEAEDLLESAILKLDSLGHKEEAAAAMLELAELHLQKEEIEQAASVCEQARKVLPELHIYQAKVNRLLGRIALKRNDLAEAERRLQMSADGFKRKCELGEWDTTMYELSGLYLRKNHLHRAARIMTEIRDHSRQVLRERGIVL